MSVKALLPADSPRIAGTNIEHVQLLAGLAAPLPPIVVHRPTMRVIDGMHRLRAAELCGAEFVDVRFVDGSTADAFVLAVELNHDHGLPLSLADRTAAAARVIDSHPEWSDRRIAAVTGLAGNTVGAIRRRSSSRAARSGARIGRDGRIRSGNSVQARLLASELIADNPNASLRDIAKAVGMSPATVSDVRARLSRGESPITPRQRVAALDKKSVARRPVAQRVSPADHVDMIQRLRVDPSLRFTEGGRTLLRILDVCAFDAGQWERIGASVPPHHRAAIVALVRHSAGKWQEFAERLANPKSDFGDGDAVRAR